MRFLYTGANAYLSPQTNPSASLGGFCSSSIVPNSRLNSLFSDGSYFSNSNGSVETKALVLENESQATVTNLKIGYQYSPTPDFKIEIAVVTLNSNQIMEQIGNTRDTPYYGTFYEANINPSLSIDHSLDLGDMIAGNHLGIWIRRTQIKKTFTAVDFSLPITPMVDAINFVLTWD